MVSSVGGINLVINGKPMTVAGGTTIKLAAELAGIDIPTLCYHPDQEIKANCRVCVVEVEGQRNLVPACAGLVSEGMVVKTSTPRVIEARKTIIELLLAHHDQDCLHCIRNGICELQNLAADYNIRQIPWKQFNRALPLDKSSPAMVRDPNKCVLCNRCVDACGSLQTVYALGMAERGFGTLVVPSLSQDLIDSPCVMCGQCIHACPVGAIYEKEDTDELMAALADPTAIVVAQIAPAVRLAISEELGQEVGSLPMEKLVAGLKAVGFDYVLPTTFTADLTIMEEGNELLKRLQEGWELPLITSCSPGWVNFCETFYPDQINHLSTCKSPQQMFGTLAKTYWANKMGIDPAKIYSVSIMPCVAKKYEAKRPEMNDSGYQDVDLVITTRELGRMFRMMSINPFQLDDGQMDGWMGEYTGAGVMFATTGGVAEAALRTLYEVVTGDQLEKLEFEDIRGMQGIKATEVDLAGTKVKVAVAHGLDNARKLMDEVRAGKSPYQFIEIMACPGGCIGGGGQPLTSSNELRVKRMQELFAEDKATTVRKSHLNPEVQKLYENFLFEPLGEKGHHLLHTHYAPRIKRFM
ncbi:MAG: NADH-dependent [FeFe] hydrogenase, group A6 [Methylocystaceae bacterium]